MAHLTPPCINCAAAGFGTPLVVLEVDDSQPLHVNAVPAGRCTAGVATVAGVRPLRSEADVAPFAWARLDGAPTVSAVVAHVGGGVFGWHKPESTLKRLAINHGLSCSMDNKSLRRGQQIAHSRVFGDRNVAEATQPVVTPPVEGRDETVAGVLSTIGSAPTSSDAPLWVREMTTVDKSRGPAQRRNHARSTPGCGDRVICDVTAQALRNRCSQTARGIVKVHRQRAGSSARRSSDPCLVRRAGSASPPPVWSAPAGHQLGDRGARRSRQHGP